ncbi:MAG TPA: zinc ribbon domain-containing protein [Natronosporangium sp.]|jgi:putative FmdB family regulatory protein|nr:zinc ribbon domain-containing protein [Natronosporangium sp.]
MAIYEYRCVQHQEFTVSFPIGEATREVPCPACGVPAARVFSAPALTRTPRRLAAAIERAGRSAEAPEVVSTIPGRRRQRPRLAHPDHARLPRP